VDVVLVTESDLEDALLPAGDRRERLAALRRADVVVLREEERERVEARVRRWMRDGAVVWSVRRELRVPDEVLAGRRVVGFCGIARPEGFWVMLAQAGCEVVEKVAFGDHHAYGAGDVERLVKLARDCGAAGFVTTEKDAVKLAGSLGGEMRAELETVGVVGVARLDAKFVDEVGVARELEGRIG
jgi:tetraacyldisaccharide 4'-kinase